MPRPRPTQRTANGQAFAAVLAWCTSVPVHVSKPAPDLGMDVETGAAVPAKLLPVYMRARGRCEGHTLVVLGAGLALWVLSSQPPAGRMQRSVPPSTWTAARTTSSVPAATQSHGRGVSAPPRACGLRVTSACRTQAARAVRPGPWLRRSACCGCGSGLWGRGARACSQPSVSASAGLLAHTAGCSAASSSRDLQLTMEIQTRLQLTLGPQPYPYLFSGQGLQDHVLIPGRITSHSHCCLSHTWQTSRPQQMWQSLRRLRLRLRRLRLRPKTVRTARRTMRSTTRSSTALATSRTSQSGQARPQHRACPRTAQRRAGAALAHAACRSCRART
jgi:hypothetical protein